MPNPAPHRIESLDLIRGIAVLGILAINIGGFAGPPAAILSPHIPAPGTVADEIGFAVKFVLFEGKLRALFTLLFGAGMAMFIERAEANGRFGELLQIRRLGWVMVFGLLHFYLLWWGDILFIYALAGILALFMHEMAIKPMAIAALAAFLLWHLLSMAMGIPDLLAEEHVRTGMASSAEAASHSAFLSAVEHSATRGIANVSGSFLDSATIRLTDQTFQPLTVALSSMGETLPLMLMGMVLYRTGFFTGGWTRQRLLRMAWIGFASGLILTLTILNWVWTRNFPLRAMQEVFLCWAAIPHLLMSMGYMAILVLTAPYMLRSALGGRLVAAGKMAFSNYLGTTVMMTAIFYGWGLDLLNQYGHAWQWLFIALGWLAMLSWSKPFLARYRRGPLEWVWRSLTEKRWLNNKL